MAGQRSQSEPVATAGERSVLAGDGDVCFMNHLLQCEQQRTTLLKACFA